MSNNQIHEEEKKNKALDKLLENGLNIFFSKDKTKLYVLLLFVFALVLRLIAANNLGLSPDDANHAVRPLGISESGKMVDYGQSSILWYYIQEFFYNIVGATQIGSRLASVIFGSLLVILIFVFTKQVFKSERLGLIASALVAASPFLVRMTLPEMDVCAIFFVLLSAFYLWKFKEKEAQKYLILSGIFIGIAILVKVYSLAFAFSFFLYLVFSKSKNSGKNVTKKQIIVFLLVVFIFCIPTLAHNYLLYKDKGFVDLLFTKTLGIGKEKSEQYYGWFLNTETSKTSYSYFFFGSGGQLPGFLKVIVILLEKDPIILVLGILGIILLGVRKEKYFKLFLFIVLPLYIYLGSQPAYLMHKHFTFFLVFLIPAAAYFLNSICDSLKKANSKIKLEHLLLVIILVNLILLGTFGGENIYSKKAESSLIGYKQSEIEKDALVITDARIYMGYSAWMFQDRNYINVLDFFNVFQNADPKGETVPTKIYFVECVSDDCGWGTIKNQPDLNQSLENIVLEFANKTTLVKQIKGGGVVKYNVYSATINVPTEMFLASKKSRVLLLYPLYYDSSIYPIFDEYNTYNIFDILIDKVAHLIFNTSKYLALLSILYVLWMFVNDETGGKNEVSAN